eukprot:4432121-Amphidinium_carterae.1
MLALTRTEKSVCDKLGHLGFLVLKVPGANTGLNISKAKYEKDVECGGGYVKARHRVTCTSSGAENAVF